MDRNLAWGINALYKALSTRSQQTGEARSIPGENTSPCEPSGGTIGQESDAPEECEECGHDISLHGKNGCTVEVYESTEEGGMKRVRPVECGCTAWESEEELTPQEEAANRLHEDRYFNSKG